MAETDKFSYIYVDNPKSAALYTATRDVVRRVRDWLRTPLQNAVSSHNLASVAYLLSHGVPPNHGNVFLVASALEIMRDGQAVEMAKLLRAHHSPLDAEALNYALEAGGQDLVDELVNPPSSSVHRCKPVPAYHYVRMDSDGSRMRVCQSWPPAGMPDSVPEDGYCLPADVRGHMISLWHYIGVMRRNEARHLSKYNWRRVRLLVQMRALAFFWQEETQKSLCAPNGQGRAQDFESFREAFASVS